MFLRQEISITPREIKRERKITIVALVVQTFMKYFHIHVFSFYTT